VSAALQIGSGQGRTGQGAGTINPALLTRTGPRIGLHLHCTKRFDVY